jgi:energy-coupling factor transport system ATP-binding protein
MMELKNVTFKYKSNLPEVLKNINFTINPGEKVLIAGKNGVGKTTLSKIMSGLIPRVEHGVMLGESRLNGKNINEYKQKELAKELSVLFQDFEAQIVATSVREELIFYPLNLGVPYEKAFEGAGLLAAKFGLSALLDRDISELSGGEKQKIEILSLLNANPKLLILDEPFTDMDPASQEFLLSFLKSGGFSGTLVVFEQSLDYFEHFDRVILLNNGEVIRNGSREVCGDLEALKLAGIEPPPLYRICGGYVKPEMNAAGLLRETKAFDRDKYNIILNEPAGSGRVVFDVKELFFKYPGNENYALEDLNFTVNEGDFLVVVGSNGSGKTTLMKILAGIYGFKKGQVFYNMKSLKTDSPLDSIGYVYQNPDNQIFAETVFDEIAFALRIKGVKEEEITSRVENMMDIFGITDKRNADPFSLPKGDRQKVACASILILWPDVIILDEPTTGLDAQSLAGLMKIMTGLNRAGKTIIIITHHMAVAARYGNKIIAMDSGRIVYHGNKRAFFADDGLLEAAKARRTEVMNLSLEMNGDMLLNEDEFEECWRDRV